MADDIGSRGEDPRDVARRRSNIGRRLREGQVRAAQGQASGPSMTPSTRSVVPYREGLPAGGGQGGGAGGGGGRGMVPSSGDRLPAPRPSSGELIRQGAGMGSGAPRAGSPRVVGGAPGVAAAALALGLTGEALRRYLDNYRNRPITGEFERSMDPEGSNEAADAERERQASQRAAPQPARPAARPAARPRMSEADRLNQMELDRIARNRSVMEGGDIQPEQPGFFERMGIRRTNETGEGAPSTGSLRGDLQALGRMLGFKKGGAINGKGMHRMPDGSMMKNEDHATMKKGNKAMMYREGGMIKPKAKTAMKKGGAVKAPAKKMAHGGKVHGPKKMMKGGMTSKPKKMMGGGRAMYAKGGMAKGCK